MAADPDGEANDIRLMPRVMPQARAAIAGPHLWVADAQFCDLDQAAEFSKDDDHFLMRFTLRNSFTPDNDPERQARSGSNRKGQAYTQDWGWMGREGEPRRCYVRRIVVKRPGQEDVIVVSDLLDADAYPAEDLLEVYLERWQIENVFQQITEVFNLQHLIGSTPKATVFQASLCLVIYNILQVVRGYVAQASPEKVQVNDLSTEKIFRDMHKDLVSLHRVLKGERFFEVLPREDRTEAVQARLRTLLGQAWTPWWKKAKPSNKPRSHQKAKQSGAHTSVHKLLEESRRQKKNRSLCDLQC